MRVYVSSANPYLNGDSQPFRLEDAFQILGPIQYHVDLRGRDFITLDHEKTLAIGRHVVVGRRGAGRATLRAQTVCVAARPKQLGSRRLKSAARAYLDQHHFVAVTIVQLAAIGSPGGVGSTLH